MLRAITAFLDFCYLIRRSTLTATDLVAVEDALARFHEERSIFIDVGVRLDFNLPRQHSLQHHARMIQLFGAPNGLCSSITEAKHIKAVKEPWRRSSRFNALYQMLLINQRLDKLAAARVLFESQGLLQDELPPIVQRMQQYCEREEESEDDEDDVSSKESDNEEDEEDAGEEEDWQE